MTAKVVALGAAGEAAAGPVLAMAPPLLKAGVLTFEPLVGGRCMWVDASLGFPNQKVSDSASVIDPIVDGRIVWRITDGRPSADVRRRHRDVRAVPRAQLPSLSRTGRT